MQCNSEDLSLKLATAIALVRSKLLQNPSSSSHSPSKSQVIRWKRLAKKRKREILNLKQQLNQIQDEVRYELFAQNTSCKCYFFDRCGKLSRSGEDDRPIAEALHRRFLRLVRWAEQKKSNSIQPRHSLELNADDKIEQLITSSDFLVELSSTDSLVHVGNYPSYATSSHQAADFILASIKDLLLRRKELEFIEEIVNSLIMRLVRRMCTPVESVDSKNSGFDAQSHVQHLIRQLGNEPYIGQRTILLLSQRISMLADNMLFMDPFDDAFPDLHGFMFMMIQLVEFLVLDYMQTWTEKEGFETRLFDEWVRSVIQAQKALNLLESRNGLYALYMDRVIGELVKHAGSISSRGMLDTDILQNLFH